MTAATLLKRWDDAPEGFFAAEAAGLRWLSAAGGARCVGVNRVNRTAIELERIAPVPPSRDAARAFGADLARTHAAGADAFGVAPDGGTGPMFIGRRRMPVAHDQDWGAFYARDRVLPFLEVAEEVGNIGPADAAVVRDACALVASGDLDDDEPASRIHGDLWSGNVLWSASGVVIIDPAAHGGHRETDLAMLALFGCAYLDDIYAGYEFVTRLRPGWRERTALHQLHPLAVHAAGHGAHYGDALVDAAREVLTMAEYS